MEKVRPIVIKDEFGNEKFVLEYNREAVVLAEKQGFNVTEVAAKPFTSMETLFVTAFHKNHPKMSKPEIDNVLKDIGGISEGMMTRLVELYVETVNTLVADEESVKNARMTVQL